MSDMFENTKLLVSCYETNCKKYLQKMKEERKKMFIESNELYDDYKSKKIIKKEYHKKANEIQKKYLNSNGKLQHIKCSLDKCYDLSKIQLDLLVKRMNMSTTNKKYNINDYNRIMLLNEKFILKNQ